MGFFYSNKKNKLFTGQGWEGGNPAVKLQHEKIFHHSVRGTVSDVAVQHPAVRCTLNGKYQVDGLDPLALYTLKVFTTTVVAIFATWKGRMGLYGTIMLLY